MCFSRTTRNGRPVACAIEIISMLALISQLRSSHEPSHLRQPLDIMNELVSAFAPAEFCFFRRCLYSFASPHCVPLRLKRRFIFITQFVIVQHIVLANISFDLPLFVWFWVSERSSVCVCVCVDLLSCFFGCFAAQCKYHHSLHFCLALLSGFSLHCIVLSLCTRDAVSVHSLSQKVFAITTHINAHSSWFSVCSHSSSARVRSAQQCQCSTCLYVPNYEANNLWVTVLCDPRSEADR